MTMLIEFRFPFFFGYIANHIFKLKLIWLMAKYLPTVARSSIEQLNICCSMCSWILTMMTRSFIYSCVMLWVLSSSFWSFRTVYHQLIIDIFWRIFTWTVKLTILFALFWNLLASEVLPMKVEYDENRNEVDDQVWDNINAVDLKVWVTYYCRSFNRIHYNHHEDYCGAEHDDPIAYSKGYQCTSQEASFILELILVEKDV